jgi:flagellar motor switch protein FliM
MADKFLTQDEVDALLKGVDGDQDDDQPARNADEIRDYNLATQERIVRCLIFYAVLLKFR